MLPVVGPQIIGTRVDGTNEMLHALVPLLGSQRFIKRRKNPLKRIPDNVTAPPPLLLTGLL